MAENTGNNNLVIIRENGKEYYFDFSKTRHARRADKDVLIQQVNQVLDDLVSITKQIVNMNELKITRQYVLEENEPILIVVLVDRSIFRTNKKITKEEVKGVKDEQAKF